MKTLNRENLGIDEQLPIKVVQFGEGNFLRAFVDYAIQELNKKADFNGGVAVVQPIEHGMVHMLNDQDGLYTLFMNGIKKGEEIRDKELVTSIVKGINSFNLAIGRVKRAYSYWFLSLKSKGGWFSPSLGRIF